jgi:hypothetical protein
MTGRKIDTFADRTDVESRGFRPYRPGEPVSVGDPVVVYARGGWRLALVKKVTAHYVYAEVATPTSPDLVTTGRGDRTGRYADLYLAR